MIYIYHVSIVQERSTQHKQKAKYKIFLS